MKKYRGLEEKLLFTDRMNLVKEGVQPRIRCRDDREFSRINVVSTHGRNPFVDEFEEHPERPYVINLANGIVRSWLVTEKVIFPHEAVVGVLRPIYPVIEHFSWGLEIRDEAHYQKMGYPAEEKKRADRLKSVLEPKNYDHLHEAGQRKCGKEKYDAIYREGLFAAGGYQGHTIPNYVTLLTLGLDGMLDKVNEWAEKNVKDQSSADFYEANRIIVRGMSTYLEGYADYAKALYEKETDETQKRYYREIADNCAFVAHHKPVTLYQAVQLTWCLSLWDWCDCLGRVDQYLYPFYQYSNEFGDVISAEESITSLMFKIWEGGAHNATLSGCKAEDGSDATNELSFLFLQILRSIHDTYPRIAVRIREDIDPNLMDLIVKMWSEGMSDPSIISDTNVIPALQRIGVPLHDARNYATLGCQEIEIPGKSNVGCEDGLFNLAKLLEIAMRGGVATNSDSNGYQIGPVTKTLAECESFEEFYQVFEEQLAYFTEIHCYLCSRGQEIREANHSKLVKGVFTDGVLESGKSHDGGGPVYGYGVIETAGLAAVADSMTAIKKLVFEEQIIPKEKLVEILYANFDGYEKERQLLLNRSPKFGNDEQEVDEMAVRVLNTYWDEIAKYKSVRGGVYTGACSLLTSGIYFGSLTGALPDGRFSGEPLGNSIGPRPGADHNGVTAMLSSVAKLPLHKGIGGTTLNVIITTKFMSTPEQRANISAIMKTYMNCGGQLAQITTANLEDLIDAQIHPEQHGNLIVRVGGYSIQFIQLDRQAQNEIIQRYSGGCY